MKGVARHCAGGFTLIEITVATAIIAVLASILIPVAISATEKANQGSCMTNQRTLATALLSYAQDNEGLFPLPSDWVAATGLAATPDVFDCPTTFNKGKANTPEYGMNAFLYGLDEPNVKNRLALSKVDGPDKTELTTDLIYPTNQSEGAWYKDEFHNPFPQTYTVPGFASRSAAKRHDQGAIVSFVDGHVALLNGKDLGTSGKSPYNIPPGYGRAYIDFSKVHDATEAKNLLQTFIAFAATWQTPGGAYNATTKSWDLTDSGAAKNAQLLTSGYGQTNDSNCFFNGSPKYATLMMEVEVTPGAKIFCATPNDHYTIDSNDPVTFQHEKLCNGYHSTFYIDTARHEFQGGLLKAKSDQNIYSNYTVKTWVPLPAQYAGKVLPIPADVTEMVIKAEFTNYPGTLTPFPTDPNNSKGWVISSNYNTGKQMFQNLNMTVSVPRELPFVVYDGPYISQKYATENWGRILLKVKSGSVRIKKILWSPST